MADNKLTIPEEEVEERVPVISQGPAPSLWEQFKSSMTPGIDPARATQAIIDSESLGISPSEAYDYHDELQEISKGDPRLSNLQLTGKERVMKRWDFGVSHAKRGLVGYQMLFNDDPVLSETADKLRIDEPQPIHKGIFEKAIGSTAEMLPIMVQGTSKGLERGLKLGAGAAAITTIAGTAGPQAVTPEEIITVPVAFASMFSVGMASGTLENIAQIEAGLGYLEILEITDSEGNRIDPTIAKSAAAGIGIINGLIEVAQIKTLIKTIPGGDKLFRKAVSETIVDVLKSKKLKDIVTRNLKKYTGFVSTETAQELAQESTNILSEELSKKLTNELKDTDFEPTEIKNIVNRLAETAKESALSFAVLGLPGSVTTAVSETGIPQKVGERIKGIAGPLIEDETGAITLGPDKDPERLKSEVIKELNKGKTIPLEILEQFKGDAVIDVAISAQAKRKIETEPKTPVEKVKVEPTEAQVDKVAEEEIDKIDEKIKGKVTTAEAIETTIKVKSRVDNLKAKSKEKLDSAREKLKDEKDNLKAITKARVSEQKKKTQTKVIEQKIKAFADKVILLDKKDKQIDKLKQRSEAKLQKLETKRREDIQKIKTNIKDKRNTETERRKSVVSHIKDNLPVSVRGKFLNATSMAKTPADFNNLFDRVNKEIDSFNKLQAESKIKGALKSKIAFIKKIGELNQTVVSDVKKSLNISKPISKMDEQELNSVLSELKKRMDFKVKKGAIKQGDAKAPEISDDIYEQNRALNSNRKKGFVETARKAKDETIKGLDKVLGVISTRLKNIDPSLKSALRRFEINLKFQDKADMEIAGKYLAKVKNMIPEDFADMDLALKNGVADKIDELNEKYDMVEEYDDTRKMLDDIYKRASDVGFDIGYRENYFPRTINDAEGFMEYVSGRDDFSILNEAIERKETALGRVLTIEEKSSLINNMIRGYKGGGITLSETGAMKERKIDFVDAEMNQFYADSNTSLISYIAQTNEAIEARKLFGKTRPVDNKTDQFNNIEDSIGFFMTQLLTDGKIQASQEKEVRDILFARLNSTGVSGAMGIFKNLGYLSIMGSPFNAVTQLGDLGFALYNAPAETLPATLRAIVGQSKITKEDLGINKIAAEFSDNTVMGNAVDTVFRLIGLNRVDSIGKEALINSSIAKYQKLAHNPDAKFLKDMDEIFGNEAPQLIEDLKSGEITENVKYLALNELLDYQPIALSEVPEQYLRAKNGKVLYMLKTFTIKMMDVFRNQVFNVMKTDKVQGIKNMIGLASALMLMNATADEIKDLMLGRETTLTDRIIDNIAKLIGFSRYSVFQVQRDGLGSTIAEQVLPPTAIIDNISKDVIKLFKDYEEGVEVSQLKSIQNIPVGGKLYYWWLGRGSKSKKNKQNVPTRRLKE